MKIVSFEEFNQMPAGTIFAPWTPCVYEENFRIKIDSGHWIELKNSPISNNEKFYVFDGLLDLIPDPPSAHNYGTYQTTQWTWDKNNNDYRDYSEFAILEPYEIDRMIKALEWAKSGCKGEWVGDYE